MTEGWPLKSWLWIFQKSRLKEKLKDTIQYTSYIQTYPNDPVLFLEGFFYSIDDYDYYVNWDDWGGGWVLVWLEDSIKSYIRFFPLSHPNEMTKDTYSN